MDMCLPLNSRFEDADAGAICRPTAQTVVSSVGFVALPVGLILDLLHSWKSEGCYFFELTKEGQP